MRRLLQLAAFVLLLPALARAQVYSGQATSVSGRPIPFAQVTVCSGWVDILVQNPQQSCNGQQPLTPPLAPTLTAVSAAAPAAGTYQVVVTYVNGTGETIGSVSTSITTSGGNLGIQVTSPAAFSNATGYNSYFTVAGGSTFYKQNSSPTAIGTNYTQNTAINTSAANPPTQTTATNAILPLASPIYSNVGQTVVLSNPFNTDGNGRYTMFAPVGNYTISIASPGYTTYSVSVSTNTVGAAILGTNNAFLGNNTFAGTTGLNGGGNFSGTFTGTPILSGLWTFNAGIFSAGPNTLNGGGSTGGSWTNSGTWTFTGALNCSVLNGIICVSPTGAYTTLAQGVAACPSPSTQKGCVIYDSVVETWTSSPIGSYTGSLEIHLSPGVWTQNFANFTLNASQRIIGSGRPVSSLPCVTGTTAGTCIQAGASFPTSSNMFRIGSFATTGAVQGARLENLGLDCGNVSGSTGIFTDAANEKSGAIDITVENCAATQVNMNGTSGLVENSSWIRMELFSPNNSVSSHLMDMTNITGVSVEDTTAIFIGTQGTTNTVLTGGQGVHFKGHYHMENSVTGLSIVGSSAGVTVDDPTGNSNVGTMVSISGGAAAGINIIGWHSLGATHAIVDANCVGGTQTINDAFGGFHFLSGQFTCQNNSTNAPSQFGGGPGTFSSGAMNEYVLSLINSCSPTTEFTLVQGASNFATDALTGCVATPSTATGQHQQNAVSGYANSSCDSAGRTRCNTVGGYFSGRAIANNAAVWGINPVTQDLVGTTGTNLTNEFDSIVNGTPAQVIGISSSIGGTGTVPTASYGVTVGNGGSGQRWNYGFNVSRGSTNTYGMVIDGLNTTNNTFSAPFALLGYDSGGAQHAAQIQADPIGILILTPASGANLKINTGVNNNGGGMKHSRVAGCATGATLGNTCDTTVTWTTAFADANYTVACSGDGLTSGIPSILGLDLAGARTAASVTVRTINNSAAAAQFTTINCIATHD